MLKTNILGVSNLLNISLELWLDSKYNLKSEFKNARFHQVSTDEVYGSIRKGAFDENSPYKPNSPYSASKASAELMVRSFNKTYNLNATISVCSNNYGRFQHEEKFMPKIIYSLINNYPLDVYGDGTNIRDWIHVNDHCRALELIFKNGKTGDKYNVGADCELSNLEIINKVSNFLGKSLKLNFIDDRKGHDFRYSINSSKIRNELFWKPNYRIEDFLRSIKK